MWMLGDGVPYMCVTWLWFEVTSPKRFADGTLLLDGHPFFCSFAHVDREVLEWKKCRSVVKQKYPLGYFFPVSQCQSDGFIDRRSMWLTRRDWVDDESRFNFSSDDNRVRVWRTGSERLDYVFALQRHAAPTAGVTVWSYHCLRYTVTSNIDPSHNDSPARILFSDEAHFWLNGYVNKQSCRIWSEVNLQVYVETPLHPEKLTVWCAVWAGGIIGPYFFKNDEGHNVTVNGDRYRAMITNFFIPELNNHDVQELWFHQDGATCHAARATIDLLKDTFGDRLISRFGPVNWPPRYCDLTPLDAM
ncbi:transposable element Tc3 transposase [Trichonephila clavipes]|nr:transposable element Tc3 transposase [Trichonephila clavipes]